MNNKGKGQKSYMQSKIEVIQNYAMVKDKIEESKWLLSLWLTTGPLNYVRLLGWNGLN